MSRRERISEELDTLAPGIPDTDKTLILDHAEDSAGLRKGSPAKVAWLSMVAFIRHTYTDYDALLADGYDVESARHFCVEQINEVLEEWECEKQVSAEPVGEGD
ncbi:DUF2293 domain-containing protein [Telmatospirillum sp.]|uniref:DUF2293 domain-containing protein n=1 Tax=Telmatospirillum sp. TaxID=2079197 RepID=UPI00284920D0|nr:DUF2293 domain-containing protein [Telmatospirillum sp.]MDR3435396.1 DUF2293 domain-containing protein [Telmatospirillum sp.]